MSEDKIKKEVNKQKITIVTHSSGFHTDDVFAVATLSLMLEKEGKEFSITRSRDRDIINPADYVVDTGDTYEPEKNRFDHHQAGGAGKRENGIPYASFGLVWKKFGKQLCGSDEVAKRIDKLIVQPIDFVDADPDGLTLFDSGVKDLHPFDIGQIRMYFHPTWKEDVTKIDEVFIKLSFYARSLIERLITFVSDEVEGEALVLEAYLKSKDKKLIFIENSEYPWLPVLSGFPEPLYVIYKNISGNWTIKVVRPIWSYDARKNLPESWAGKSGEDLEKITGVEGSVFCHNARFMAVAKTKEAILKLAEIALNS